MAFRYRTRKKKRYKTQIHSDTYLLQNQSTIPKQQSCQKAKEQISPSRSISFLPKLLTSTTQSISQPKLT
jgi:hypothetical protein